MSDDRLHSGRWPMAVVPEWLFDRRDLPGEALRLYCVLARLAQRSGFAYPLRATLAERLGWSTAKLDRMLGELVRAGAIRIEHQFQSGTRILAASRYIIVSEPPAKADHGPDGRFSVPQSRSKSRRPIPLSVRLEVLARDGMVCQLCKSPIKSTTDLTFDHRIPWSKGGATDATNLQVAHRWCNLNKRDVMPTEAA